MRFLLDANLSPCIVARLAEAGFQSRHVGDFGLSEATDSMIFDRAAVDGDVLLPLAESPQSC